MAQKGFRITYATMSADNVQQYLHEQSRTIVED